MVTAAVAVTAAALIPAVPASAATTPLIVTAVAGHGGPGAVTPGPATAGHLGSPQGVAVDPAGDVLIADTAGNVIEKVTPGGTLSIIAGTGTAGQPTPGPATASSLHAPAGVAVDGAGDLYIADTGNHVVEEVTPAGVLSIVAGTGAAGLPVAGPATSSPLGGPSALALDAAGDLYIADGAGASGNPYVEEVTPAGRLSVFAGDGARGLPTAGAAISSPLRAPTGIAVDPSGDVFIADAAANSVRQGLPRRDPLPVRGPSRRQRRSADRRHRHELAAQRPGRPGHRQQRRRRHRRRRHQPRGGGLPRRPAVDPRRHRRRRHPELRQCGDVLAA